MNHIRTLFVACSVAVLAACGGGGDGAAVGGGNTTSSTTPSFAGKYLENAKLTTNSCNFAIPAAFAGTDVVTQDGRNVTIVSGEFTFTGAVDADNGGFTVSGTFVFTGITMPSTVKYRTTATGSTYAMDFSMVPNGCTIVYTGTATKI
ncbi:MAG: hypothetical protein ABIT72_00275 [Burkholderiaceae bacterium]